jgi:hypothetical protein
LISCIRKFRTSLVDRNYLPATLSIATVLVILAAAHGTWYGSLPIAIRDQFGHAPQHAFQGRLDRILSSLPLTSDPSHLGFALCMTLLCVGWLEIQKGWRWALGIFFASHIATLVVERLLISMGSSWMQSIRNLMESNDIGPSAGYYGCLGTSVGLSKVSIRRWLAPGVAVVLLVRWVVGVFNAENAPTTVQSDLAHLIAFGFGLAASRLTQPKLPSMNRPEAG